MFQFLYFLVAAGVIFLALRLTCGPCVMGSASTSESASINQSTPRLPVIALGWSLSLFLAITFVVCVGFDLIFPQFAMYNAWIKLLPGFIWISWSTFFIGLIESFLYGWYAALVFGAIFNFVASRK